MKSARLEPGAFKEAGSLLNRIKVSDELVHYFFELRLSPLLSPEALSAMFCSPTVIGDFAFRASERYRLVGQPMQLGWA